MSDRLPGELLSVSPNGTPRPVLVPPWLVLALCLVTTLLLGGAHAAATDARDEARIQRALRETESRIVSRIDTHVALLHATRGWLMSSGDVDAERFRAFVDALALDEHYPGVLGIGFSERFVWADRAWIEEGLAARGLPGVWPDDPRDEGNAIVLLEPLSERNRAAIGFDMATEPVRRQAMERARDTGEATMSGPVTLVQELSPEQPAGMLVFLPVYRDAPSDVAERRAQLVGYAYSPIRPSELFQSLFPPGDATVGLVVRDVSAETGAELYRSPGFTAARRSATARLEVVGRPWTLTVEASPAFLAGSGAWLTPWILLFGIALSFVFYALARRQRRIAAQLGLHSRVLASMSEGVSVLDRAGVVLYTNPAEDRMLGYGAGELVGRHARVRTALGPGAFARLADEVGRRVGDGQTWVGELPNVRKDGSEFPALARITAVDGPEGRCFVAVEEDVTARRQAEREREHLLERERAARETAERANRVKDEFLAMLGHELRNPLAPIVTALEILRRRGVAGDPAFAVLERQVRHLRRLVDDLLDVSRITRGQVDLERRPVSIRAVIGDAVDMVEPLVRERRHSLHVDVPDGWVDGDAGRLIQVFGNLLTNAAKYTEPGGHLSVTASASVADGGDDLVITVADDGVGIAPEMLPVLFEPFVRGHRSGPGGLGIGLAVARGLVALHGGRISARSAGPGQGSALEVRLRRRAPPAPAPPAAPEVPERARSTSGLRVLVVDDNVDAARTLADVLSYAGHDVEVAVDPGQALRAVEERHPDVAILDIGMPDMDGYELAERIPEPKPVLFALTGYGTAQDRLRSLAVGFRDHFAKPADPDALLRALDAVSPPTEP